MNISLPFNSHHYQNSPDFGSGDFQYTSPLAFSSTAYAHDLLLVSVLVSEVELKLPNVIDHNEEKAHFT